MTRAGGAGVDLAPFHAAMTELSQNAKLALESLQTKPALNTPALIAQNEGIGRTEAEAGLAELKEAGLVKESAMGWKLKPQP